MLCFKLLSPPDSPSIFPVACNPWKADSSSEGPTCLPGPRGLFLFCFKRVMQQEFSGNFKGHNLSAMWWTIYLFSMTLWHSDLGKTHRKLPNCKQKPCQTSSSISSVSPFQLSSQPSTSTHQHTSTLHSQFQNVSTACDQMYSTRSGTVG